MIRHVTLALGLLVGTLAGAADINLSVDNATPNVNTTIAVTIRANIPAGEAFVAANQFLTFDHTKLVLTAQNAGNAGIFVPDSRGLAEINASGEVRAGAYAGKGAVSGNVVLGVFAFKAVAAGVTQVRTAAYDVAWIPFGNVLYRAGGALVVPTTPGSLTITIGGGSSNHPPQIVSAAWADPNTVTLPGTTEVQVVASDSDGDPLTYTWSRVSGPGTVSFTPNGTTASDASTAGFSAAGTYVLRVTVSDGKGGSASSEVTVVVNGGGGTTGPGDLTGDGKVNIDDLVLVVDHFGQGVGDPNWDVRADGNRDGVVNIMDLTLVTSNFGKTY